MAELSPEKKDLEIIFRRLRSIPTNKICFDCTAKIPTWASITYGVFICIDCSAVHRSLGVHLSFVRSTQLDTNWTWLQIRQMQLGGNANAESFFQQHNCSTKDSQQKYNSRAAQLYKSKLQTAAVQAMKTHGTKLFLDRAIGQDIHQEESEKEYDFFEDHSFSKVINSDVVSVKPIDIENTKAEEKKAPSVNMNPSSLERQTIIGARKPQTKRSGIGNKKGLGFGAQKISTNFADVEREAVLAEKIKEAQKETEIDNNKKKKELDDDEIASMRLAYEDLSLKQKRETERLKINDPKKATQMERLGMGVGSRVGISHSALSDMKTIHQESSSKFNKMQDTEAHDFFDDFGISSSSSYSSVYKNASQSRMSLGTDDNEDTFKSLINSSFESSFTPQTSYNNNPKSQNNFNNTYKSHNNNVKKNASLPSEANTDAQKKFGAAKSISSDQYFSDSVDNTWEQKSNLSRFEGSTSISSADYFGRNENAHQRNYISSQLQAPDLEEVRESVKQSVNKVAGKLSSLASGVISSIQDKYGGY